jgi:NAD-reducing hydrogenase small subunit
MSKPRVATAALAGCFGCHMSLLDIDERLLDLIELVEFNKSPIDDIKEFTKRCDGRPDRGRLLQHRERRRC